MHRVTSNKVTVTLGFILISLLTLYSYHDIPNQSFLQWDDITYIEKNKHLHNFSVENIVWMFTDFHLANWHPVTWLSLTFNYAFWGSDPAMFKLVNILIHIFTSFLLFLVTTEILKLIKNIPNSSFPLNHQQINLAGLFTAMLFAIHPQHIESVIWISERKDVLCGFFYLATIYFYIQQIKNQDRFLWVNLTSVCFLLALMSKSMAVTIPLTLMLLDIYPLNRVNFSEGLKKTIWTLSKNKIIYIVLSICVSAITVLTQSTEIQGTEVLSVTGRIINACTGIVHYISTIFYPPNLSAFHPFSESSLAPSLYSIVPISIVVSAFILCVYFWKKDIKYPLIVWLFLIFTLLPVLGIVKVGHAAAADRYAYIPTLGIYMWLGALCSYFLTKNNFGSAFKVTTHVLAILILGVLVQFTNIQSKNWRSDETLWVSVIEKYPNKVVAAHNNLADVYFERKEYTRAIAELNKALSIDKADLDALKNMAVVLKKLNKYDSAEEYYKKMVQLNPKSVSAHETVGDHYYEQKQLEKAYFHYNKALQLSPNSPDALAKSALMDYAKNDYNMAEKKLKFALQVEPEHKLSLQLLAQIQFNRGNLELAEKTAHDLLHIDPNDKFAKDVLSYLSNQR